MCVLCCSSQGKKTFHDVLLVQEKKHTDGTVISWISCTGNMIHRGYTLRFSTAFFCIYYYNISWLKMLITLLYSGLVILRRKSFFLPFAIPLAAFMWHSKGMIQATRVWWSLIIKHWHHIKAILSKTKTMKFYILNQLSWWMQIYSYNYPSHSTL